VLIACIGCAAPSTRSPSAEVKPMIGTGGLGYGVGSIPPGPTLPFGMAKPGPDTSLGGEAPDFEHCAGYWYEDDTIRGFSQIHLSGTGVPDYGVLMLMPAVDLPPGPIAESAYSAQLDHKVEKAEVGRYDVTLLPSRIEVEISATLHTSIYRLRFPAHADARVIVSLAHSLHGEMKDGRVDVDAAAGRVSGSLVHRGKLSSGDVQLFFAMRFDHPFASVETFAMGGVRAAGSTSTVGPDIGAILAFASPSDPIGVQIGLSFIDIDTANQNLDAEWMGWDIDRARAEAVAAWDRTLNLIEIDGGSAAHRAAFYTALYHAHFMPTTFTESGGRFRGLDGAVHTADGFVYASDFSLWDTFRTVHPLFILLEPDRALDFAKSLLEMTVETGRIPKWPLATHETDSMIGYHGETVMADSYLKGIRGFDIDRAYGFLRAAALDPRDPTTPMSLRRRDCIVPYLEHGYCPTDAEGGSVSKTIENSFADFVLSNLANALGHAEDAATFGARARSWRALVDSTHLVQGRTSSGAFSAGFREDLFSPELVEGNARQWSTFVPHDIEGYSAAHGGSSAAADDLARLFENAAAIPRSPLPELWYWAGNEPDIHAPYMFAELGRHDLTERWVDWAMNARYDDTPAGLPGNDDGGTMSAWYVFSALGFYPKVGEGRYVLGKPLFPRAIIHLARSKTLTVTASGWSDSAIYVRRVSFNGKMLSGPFIDHADLVQGGELVFEMESAPAP
jgi:predicted alpha-1,2-mannosidase